MLKASGGTEPLSQLAVPEVPVHPGTGTVIASRETWRRLIIPVTVEAYVEIEFPQDLYVVGGIQIQVESPRIGKGG